MPRRVASCMRLGDASVDRPSFLPQPSSEELRRRFLRAETKLFQLRFEDGDSKERQTFLSKLSLGWEEVRLI